MDGDQIVAPPEQVQLSRQDHVAGLLGGIDHDEVVAGVGVATGAFVRPGHLLERQLVEAKRLPEQRDLCRPGIADVEPQPILAVGEQLAEPVDADLRREAAVARVEDESHGSHGASYRDRSAQGPIISITAPFRSPGPGWSRPTGSERR